MSVMKTLILIAFTFFYIPQMAALPVGNPASASLFFSSRICPTEECESIEEDPCLIKWNLSIGYYGDYVFNRNLKTVKGKYIDYSHFTTNALYLALNYQKLLELFATFGVSKFSFNTSLVPFNSSNRSPRFLFQTASDFSWSVGARSTLWSYKDFSFGVMGQYFTFKPHTEVWFLPNLSGRPNEDRSRYSEWQLGAGFAYYWNDCFIPYVAAKWSRALWEFNDKPLFVSAGGAPVATLINLKSGKQLGLAIGLSFAPFACNNLAVTIEGRFGDETVLHVNGKLFF